LLLLLLLLLRVLTITGPLSSPPSTRWQRLITQRADAMKVKPHSVIPLPQTEYVPPLLLLLASG
jgi:hypothetical protein